MGANAQTTVQKFVDGAVLTAAQQNTSAATGVPVFATTVTRDAAFGGANKVLAEGQTCYLESTNVVQYYDGAAWATVGPAAAGALVRIGGGALSSTSTAFSGAFSATYDAYDIVVSNLKMTGTNAILRMTVGSTAAGYYYAQAGVTYAGATNPNSEQNVASWNYISQTNVAGAADSGNAVTIKVTNPFLSAYTIVQYTCNAILSQVLNSGGYLNNTTSYTAFTLTTSGSAMSGTVNIYGYALS